MGESLKFALFYFKINFKLTQVPNVGYENTFLQCQKAKPQVSEIEKL